MFFELGNSSGPAADFQDLVMLVTATPSGGVSGGGSGTGIPVSNSTQWNQSGCIFGTASYRVGVIAYEDFEPYFLPRNIFGDQPEGLSEYSVAEVTPVVQKKVESFNPDCGVYSDEVMTINGNNLSADQTNFCGNSDVLAAGSQNGTMGDIYHFGGLTKPKGSVGKTRKLNRRIPTPDFNDTDPATYDAVLDPSNCNSWPSGARTNQRIRDGWGNQGRFALLDRARANLLEVRASLTTAVSPQRWISGILQSTLPNSFIQPSTNPSPTSFRVRRFAKKGQSKGQGQGQNQGGPEKVVQTQSGQPLYWSNGDKVTATYDGTGTCTISGNNKGSIQLQDGSPASIYSAENLTLDGNGLDIDGGLYSKGDVTVNGNNHVFDGDPNKKGGLALWAEGNVNIKMNNIEMNGILGSEGNLSLGSNGGGTGPDFSGMVVSDGTFTFPSNSNNAQINHNKGLYKSSALNFYDWKMGPQQNNVSTPTFANVEVRLIK